GADAAAHEHRNVLWTPDDRPDLLSAEEIIEDLRDAWQLDLNIDITQNVDEDGRELGVTPWRCIVRIEGPERTRYAEIVVTAECLLHAEELAYDATIGLLAVDEAGVSEDGEDEPMIVTADRQTPAQLNEFVRSLEPEGGERVSGGNDSGLPAVIGESRVLHGRWLV
ncbi:MAG: hypothetical protein K8E66_06030, partial [Phycisphaerales bacterium]|nr:hypothetical protein [Phycisphaerales bacterium]